MTGHGRCATLVAKPLQRGGGTPGGGSRAARELKRQKEA
jgi:hypothetical protein